MIDGSLFGVIPNGKTFDNLFNFQYHPFTDEAGGSDIVPLFFISGLDQGVEHTLSLAASEGASSGNLTVFAFQTIQDATLST